MSEDDLENRLERLGRDSGPAADPAFANRLETDLRMMTASRADLSTARPWWQPVMLASVALMFVVAGFVAVRDHGQGGDVVMTAADDTMLVLPDGTEAAGAEGIELADGTRIVVGLDGSAVVAGIVLPAGTEAVVVDGLVEIVGPGSAPDQSTGGVDDDPGTLDPDDEIDSSAPATTAARTTTESGVTSSTSARPATSSTVVDRSSTTASPAPTTTMPVTTSSTDGVSPTSATPRATIELGAEPVGDGRIRLLWTTSGLGEVAGWRVLATSGDRTAVVLVIRQAAASEVMLERLDGEVGYRVVAVAADGNVLAESNLVVI